MNDLTLSVVRPVPSEYHAKVWDKLFCAWRDQIKPDFSGLVQVSFVSRARMKEFYSQAYGEDHATDVLSLRHTVQPGVEGAVAGEIVICSAVARIAARRLKTDAQTEFATLFVHGLLHLSDLTHDEPDEQDRFHKLTHDIMATQSLRAISLWSA